MLKTPLDSLHRELGARMVPFAGYDMPVQYPSGILAEHLQTRASAGLFDVSHMGQLRIAGSGVAAALEKLVPVDLQGLAPHAQTYALLTNAAGGVLDDLIITRWGEDEFFLVVNAGCKAADIAHLRAAMPTFEFEIFTDHALLALQGPAAREVLAALVPQVSELTFMHGCKAQLGSDAVYITCSGYTGEDGFEVSLPAAAAEPLARQLLADQRVLPIGLGARDSLRLEAGLCLYGHELAADISPVAAGLMWSIGKARREDGERAGGFAGSDEIFRLARQGVARRRVGLLVNGKRPVRDGQHVLDSSGAVVGVITSACFAASLGAPVAMAYVDSHLKEIGTQLNVEVRGSLLPVTVTRMPFVPQRYFRG